MVDAFFWTQNFWLFGSTDEQKSSSRRREMEPNQQNSGRRREMEPVQQKEDEVEQS